MIDEDQVGEMRYVLDGDGLAPFIFRIDQNTGAIYVRDGPGLRNDRATNYTVRHYNQSVLYITLAFACYMKNDRVDIIHLYLLKHLIDEEGVVFTCLVLYMYF